MRVLKSADAAVIFHEMVDKFIYHQTRGELVFFEGEDWFFHTSQAIENETAK